MAFGSEPRYTITSCVTEEVDPNGYSEVANGIDKKTGLAVRIRKVDLNEANSYRCHREILTLGYLKHPNIVELLDVMLHPNTVYLIHPTAETTLWHILREVQPMKLPDDSVKVVSRGMFQGLEFIHAANVMHRNLSPYSILITQHDHTNWDVKISDFGWSRIGDKDRDHVESKSVGVGYYWYRAPETLDAFEHGTGEPINDRYTDSVDLWAAGCIVAEMVLGRTLFAGHNAYDQLTRIVRAVGSPQAEEMSRLSEQTRIFLHNLGRIQPQQLRDLIPTASNDCLDFLSRILIFDRSARMNALQALGHPFIGSPKIPQPTPRRLPDLEELTGHSPDGQRMIRLLAEELGFNRQLF